MQDGTRRAQALLETGRWPDAFQELTTVLRHRPDDVEALCLLAHCYDLAGDPPGTVAATERVLAVAPGHSWALRRRALALVALNRRRDALLSARAAAAAAPEDWRTHATLAEVLLHQSGMWALVSAREAADTVLRMAPEEADAHLVDSQVCLGTGEVAAARRACLRALELDPQHQAALHNLAVIDLRRERLGSAGRGFGAALALAPQDRVTGAAQAQGAWAVWWRVYDALAAATVLHLVVFWTAAGALGPWRLPLALGTALLLLIGFGVLCRRVWRVQPEAARARVRADRRQPVSALWLIAVAIAAFASTLGSAYAPTGDSVAGNLVGLAVAVTGITLAVRVRALLLRWVWDTLLRLLFRSTLLLNRGWDRLWRRRGAAARARG